jgi:hypothetical protein
VTVAIGVNDWQGGADPHEFGGRLATLLRGLLATCAGSRIAVISALWVPDA